MSSDFPNCEIFKPPRHDHYWQLREGYPASKQHLTDILLHTGYEVKKSANKDELQSLVRRAWMGRLCYDKCSHLDLKQFAVARDLVDARKKPTKRWLADRLIAGDDNRSFMKIFDLPPELRRLIYEFYISDFNEDSLEEPTQPPLARTCRMMRNEVLPMFYSKCMFDLKFSTMPSHDTSNVRFRMDPSSFIWLATLAPGCIGDIRQLGIQFKDAAFVLDYKTGAFWVDIDLNAGSKLCRTDSNDEMGKKEQQVRSEVRKVLKKVFIRERGKRLTLQDLYDVGSAVERALDRKLAPK
jgi:hypothetical protein